MTLGSKPLIGKRFVTEGKIQCRGIVKKLNPKKGGIWCKIHLFAKVLEIILLIMKKCCLLFCQSTTVYIPKIYARQSVLIKPVNPSCGYLLLTYISMREVRTWKHEWQTNRTSSSAGGPCNTAERVHTTSGWQCDVLWICTLSAKIKHLLNPLYLQFSSSFLPPIPLTKNWPNAKHIHSCPRWHNSNHMEVSLCKQCSCCNFVDGLNAAQQLEVRKSCAQCFMKTVRKTIDLEP